MLLANLRVSDRSKDHEADLVILSPGAGIVVVEVKCGSVWHAKGEWFQARGGDGSGGATIDPVGQARDARYALREYVEADPRWRPHGRRRVRWAHALVLPNATLPDDYAAPDCPRWMVADRTDLHDLARFLRAIPISRNPPSRCSRPTTGTSCSTSWPGAARLSATSSPSPTSGPARRGG